MDDTRIVIEHDTSADAMGFAGSEDLEMYDFNASLERYEEMLEAELKRQYPGADVTIRSGWGRYTINGEQDGQLDAVVADVWGGFEWLVKR